LKVRWRPAAEADRDGIIDYIAQDDPVAAIDLGDAIDRQVAELPKQAKLYRVGRVKGTREMVVHPNYIVVYRIVRGEIEILRVLHSARQWPFSR
jgi:toxin ParE1/3/4